MKRTKIKIKNGNKKIKNNNFHKSETKRDNKKKIKFKILFIFIVFLITLPIAFTIMKTAEGYNKVFIGENKGGFIDMIGGLVIDDPLKGEKEDRINFLAIGYRGEEDSNGGLLADTIMFISFKPSTKEIGMISIPRDLAVKIPGSGNNVYKINETFYYGEQRKKNGGMELMAQTVSSVLDQPIHYIGTVDLTASIKVIDILGGIDVYLEKPFKENKQFQKEFWLDLDAGWHHFDGNTAMLYARSRYTTDDFDRARRQQDVVKSIREKATKLGILTNPSKVIDLFDTLSSHVKTNLSISELKRLIKITEGVNNDNINQLVFDYGSDGYLYSTMNTKGQYILRPKNEDFTRMREDTEEIFTINLNNNNEE